MLPAGPQNPHPTHPFHHGDAVDGATNWPPSIPSFFKKLGARKPLVACNQWSVATVAAGLNFETEKLAPVFQAGQPNKMLVGRERRLATQSTDGLANSPQADRIKPDNNRAAVGTQHPINFAQDLMRVICKLQHMGQYNQIGALGRYGQLLIALNDNVGRLNTLPVVGGIVAAGNREAATHAVLP